MSLQYVRNVAATRRGDKPLLVYISGHKLVQQLTATQRSDKSLYVNSSLRSWREWVRARNFLQRSR